MNDSSLMHYGIRGQKWGIRRFQNADGTRTAAGKKRYSENGEESQKKGLSDRQKTAIKVGIAATATALAVVGAYKLNKAGKFDGLKKAGQDAVNKAMAKVSKSKVPMVDISKMSDEDLKKHVARLSLENQYKKMTSSNSKSDVQAAIDKAMKTAGGIAAATSTGLTIYNNMDRIKKIVSGSGKKK